MATELCLDPLGEIKCSPIDPLVAVGGQGREHSLRFPSCIQRRFENLIEGSGREESKLNRENGKGDREGWRWAGKFIQTHHSQTLHFCLNGLCTTKGKFGLRLHARTAGELMRFLKPLSHSVRPRTGTFHAHSCSIRALSGSQEGKGKGGHRGREIGKYIQNITARDLIFRSK